jgi:hypothetical protein
MCRIWKANALPVCLTIGVALMILTPATRADQNDPRDGRTGHPRWSHARPDRQGSGRAQTRESHSREGFARNEAEHGRQAPREMASGRAEHRGYPNHRGRWEGRNRTHETARVSHRGSGGHFRSERFHHGKTRHRGTMRHHGESGRHHGTMSVRGRGWRHRTVSHRAWSKERRGSTKAERGREGSRDGGGLHPRGEGRHRDRDRTSSSTHETRGRRRRDF